MSDDEQIERVARALWVAHGRHPDDWGSDLRAFRQSQDELLRLAAAAIAALAPVGPPADTWSALADELDLEAKAMSEYVQRGFAVLDPVAVATDAASRIRAALAGGTAQ